MSQTRRTDRIVALRPPRHRVEKRAVAWWMLRSAAWWLLPVAAGWVVAAVWEPARVWLVAPLIVMSVVVVAKLTVEPGWRYRVHRWEIEDGITYASNGWIVAEWRTAPASRVQTVDVTRGPIEQLLGLATVRVTTASSYGSIVIGGLRPETAAVAAARLADRVATTEGDAT